MRLLYRFFPAGFLLSASALASDWYVDQSAVNCPGAGTPISPFCRISDAITAAVDGDVIRIAPGIYLENLVVAENLVFVGTAGAATTILDGGSSGSILRMLAGARVELVGLTLRNGRAAQGSGGAIQAIGGSLVLRNSQVQSCWADVDGGAIHATDAAIEISDTVLTDHRALRDGGAIALVGGSLSASAMQVNRSRAERDGGGIHANGSTLDLWSSSVRECDAWVGAGGGIYARGAAPVRIFRTSLILNTAVEDGGGARLLCPSRVDSAFVYFNTSAADGGGISVEGWITTILSTVFVDNACDRGCGLDAVQASLELIGCSFRANVAATNGGGARFEACTGEVHSCIFWQNIPDEIDGALPVSYSDVRGGYPGLGNIDADPVFFSGNDHRFSASSPCIDTGKPGYTALGIDRYRLPRIADGNLDGVEVIDMGAHEFAHSWLSTTNASPTLGGSTRLLTSGTTGLAFVRFLGFASGNFAIPPFGQLLFDPLAGYVVIRTGVTPNDWTLQLPAWMPTPARFYLQDLFVDPVRGAGGTSNVLEINVR